MAVTHFLFNNSHVCFTKYKQWSNLRIHWCIYSHDYNFIAWEIECGCNIDDVSCTNSTCKTDILCQRLVSYTNGVITLDHQMCKVDDILQLCNSVEKYLDGSTILIVAFYCCRTRRCNENDTLLEMFIRNELGKCMYCCVVYECYRNMCMYHIYIIHTYTTCISKTSLIIMCISTDKNYQ